MNEEQKNNITEKILKPASGGLMLILLLCALLITIGGMVGGSIMLGNHSYVSGGILLAISVILFIADCIAFAGLKIVGPNEAVVFTLFGNYYGTLTSPGFYYVNPFVVSVNPAATQTASLSISTNSATVSAAASKKVSTKTMTLTNEKQKVNDILGNPVIIGAIVIWNVESPTKAVLNVQNYIKYLSVQCDSIIRNTARMYPYDTSEKGDEKSLRGSSQEIAEIMCKELQEKVENAGIKILEVRITHLAYAPEIASAMLQRQQAAAIIDARQKIVEGAVGMVEMALDKLNENDIVELDEERKAAMVSNLLVVLCGNKDAQPIVNSGSLY